MKLPKLIASDLDGTLVPEGAPALPEGLVALLDEVQALGIPFAVSSGRQADSLRRVFAPLAQPPLIMALNGGVLMRGEELLMEDPMPRKAALEIALAAAQRPDVWVILETADECWVLGSGSPLRQLLEQRQYHVRVIDDLDEVQGEIIKVACYTQRDPDALERWALSCRREGIKAARSGSVWVDFNVADKGRGIRAACAVLGITPDEVMAFGDNLNDAAMLDAAGEGYAVAGSLLAETGACPVCPSVEAVLEKICAEAKKHLQSDRSCGIIL